MKKWIRRIALGLLGIVVLAVTAGASYELIGRSLAHSNYPPPGKRVDIGGRRIQLDCRGTGSPVVVFESGLDISGSLSWAAVHDPIARITRTCAYSRAGIMWSDPREGAQTGRTVAEDLHAALSAAGERPPFVLVGHSLGGPYTLLYTKYFPSDVAGLVLVDPSHPDQFERFKPFTSGNELKALQAYKMLDRLAWAGVARLGAAITLRRLPHWPAGVVGATVAYASSSLGGMLKEVDSLEQTLADTGTARQLGDRPLIVLSAMAPFTNEALAALKLTPAQGRQLQEIGKTMHDEEASWSSDSRHQLVPDAGHYIQFDRPDVVVAAVASVVNSVRAKR